MKHCIFWLILIIAISTVSCKNHLNQKSTNEPTSDTSRYFSIKGFFENEMHRLDSLPYYIYQITTYNNIKRDSVGISKPAFDSIARQFVTKDIAANHLQAQYKEQLFKDLSTNSVTINYSTTNRDLEVQNVDILLNEETGKVKRIFIRTDVAAGDSSVTKNYSWKAGKSFLITTTVVKTNGSKNTTVQFINWNDVN